jgi:ParB-like chromosome segregation protein Spo0J
MSELIKLDQIAHNPYQGREEYGDIETLARSIAVDDLQEMPKARKNGKGYELKFGHRRTEAFRWLRENFKAQGLPDRYQGYTVMPLDIEDVTDEQMYRGAVIENEHRQNLTPIEQAEMMAAYRDQFQKTSDEIGVLFGVSGATVRGKVRLLDLPDAAQTALRDGRISEGAARSLLSVAKIANEETVNLAVKEIEKNKDNMLPEEVIEHIVDRLDNTVEMWQGDGRKEKPRAGHNLWLLDMKNFPNKALPLISPSEIMAVVGTADNSSLAVRYLNGEKDAPLADELKAKVDHLINPPACNACPFYTVINGSHYCGVKMCHERKAAAFKAQKLADMSRDLKIAIYQVSDGTCIALDEIHASHRKVYEKRHADLRLLPKARYSGYIWQNFKGFDRETAVLVVVGESADKLAVRGSKVSKGGKKSEKEKAEMRAMRLFRQVRRELVWEYTAAAKTIFDGVPSEVLKKIRSWHFVGIDDRIPDEYNHPKTGTDDQQLEFAQRDLVWALVIGKTSHYTRHELAEYLTEFANLTGVKAPKSLVKKAQDWDAEIADLAKPVAVETKGKKK